MALAPVLTLNFAAATDIGCKRGNNEDSFGYDAELHIYVVCDGMGGGAAGERWPAAWRCGLSSRLLRRRLGIRRRMAHQSLLKSAC